MTDSLASFFNNFVEHACFHCHSNSLNFSVIITMKAFLKLAKGGNLRIKTLEGIYGRRSQTNFSLVQKD